jgi:2-oxoglutarate dehydrogenase E2 component (dihydrolipoamide succinyltransferase)
MQIIDIIVPLEQEGTKAIVRSWLKKIGDPVALDDPLVELETDKVTQEVPAPATGILTEILLDTDAEAVPGTLLGRMRIEDQIITSLPDPTQDEATHGKTKLHLSSSSSSSAFFSPSVRRALAQHGIDPTTIVGTGRDGRLTRMDVEAVAMRQSLPQSSLSAPSTPVPAPKAATTTATAPVLNGVRSVPHDRMRLAIATNMLNSVTIAPHVTAVFEADFSAISAHRRAHKVAFEKAGANLTFTAYLIAASVAAMRAAPTINSRWHEDRLEIFEDVSIGVGTALGDKGLVVPVIASAQKLSLEEIALQLTSLTLKARENRLIPADVRGGTFTISNHGVSGSLLATPIIISQPQSAILGIGKLEKRVVVREVDGIDTIQIRPMCYVSLTIDHRVVDGHQTNLWLSKFVETIECWPHK